MRTVRTTLLPAALTIGAICLPAVAHAQNVVGSLTIVRQVEVTRGTVTPGQAAAYIPARDKQVIRAGQGVRTLKRSQAEVSFRDGSALRINERSDVIVQDSATLRNVQLREGLVWVRVAKGVRTQVETPSATAVARGTVFTVGVGKDGSTTLTVLEGIVGIQVGGKSVDVNPGQTITVKSVNGVATIPDKATDVPKSALPVEFGGGAVGWWNEVAQNGGTVIAPGSSAILDLRSSPLTEAIQQIAAANNTNPGPNYYLDNTAQRNQFLQIARNGILPAINASGLSASAYQAQFGSLGLGQLGLTVAQQTTLQSLGITTVGQAINTLNANFASANITVASGRSEYRPGSVTGQPNFDYRLLDRNTTGLGILGIGAAAALLADSKGLTATVPTLSGEAFGFLNNPGFLGGRADLNGIIGKTHYQFESNVLRITTGKNKKTYSKLDSVAVVTHPLGESTTLFAGRRRFYEGPVFQDASQSQLIADRYSSAGATYKKSGLTVTGAYLHDANPDARGAQHGALGSVTSRITGGGTVGLHYLHVAKVRDGNGYSASVVYPIVRNQVDFYGEVGRAPDKATIQTYGAYLPGLYQKTDIDFFVEYGSHEGLGHSLSLIASRDLAKVLNVRAYATFQHGTDNISTGLAGIYRFSTK